ncbi:hypothetical protein [Mucilaginibacter sp. OK283]|uniref:hypothetical protein n=1 Tax=Mucilaginibacter sp. OK283 TaxID=1881049 RepID=UPI0008CDF849|nr:hypothetical protein [Mucilaginibacter sp. OK283]SEP41465.1 hypothetical protein SAMN05428947_11578 [Mucilaginibacter sp. OK283]
MKTLNISYQTKAICLMILFLSFLFSIPVRAQDKTHVRNVALVYGAFADGPGWQQVYELLTKKAKNLHLKILQKQGVFWRPGKIKSPKRSPPGT